VLVHSEAVLVVVIEEIMQFGHEQLTVYRVSLEWQGDAYPNRVNVNETRWA